MPAKKQPKKDLVVAKLSVLKPGKMSFLERGDIAAWLRRQAEALSRPFNAYTDSGYFTARYYK